MVNFEVRRAQLAKSTLHIAPRWGPWDLFRSFKVYSDAKSEWGAESNGKLPHLFFLSKTVIPESAVEDLLLSKTAVLVPEFAMKDYPWAEQSDDDDERWNIYQ